jgi:hypothetical protein
MTDWHLGLLSLLPLRLLLLLLLDWQVWKALLVGLLVGRLKHPK